MNVERTALLRLILSEAALVVEATGKKNLATKLRLTRVNLDAQLSCVHKALRQLEPELLGPWAVARLGAGPAGLAYEALQVVKLAAVSALAHGDDRVLLGLLGHLSLILDRLGVPAERRGTIGREVDALREALEIRDDDSPNP